MKVISGVVAGNANVCVYRFLLIRAISDYHFTGGGTLEFESSDYGAPLLSDFATLLLKGGLYIVFTSHLNRELWG